MTDPRSLRYGYTAETAPPGMRWAYEMLAPTPGTQYGDILPVKKDASGNIGFAMPNTMREGLLGMADLLSGVDTGELTGRGAASVTMGGVGTAMGLAPRGAIGMGGARIARRGNGMYDAYMGDKFAGTASVAGDGKQPFMSIANVEPAFRKQGIGKQLYSAAEEDLGRGLVPSPLGLSEDAIAFWRKRLNGLSDAEKRQLLDEARALGRLYGISEDSLNRRFEPLQGLFAPAPVAPPGLNVQPPAQPAPGFNLPNGLRPVEERVY